MTILFDRQNDTAQWLDVEGFEPWRGKYDQGRFNGWAIRADDYPEVFLEGFIALPGENRSKDLLPFGCPADQMDSVAQALKEWAESVGVEMEVRWETPTKEQPNER